MTTNTNPDSHQAKRSSCTTCSIRERRSRALRYRDHRHPNMRQVLNQNMRQTCADQYSLFDQMRNRDTTSRRARRPARCSRPSEVFDDAQPDQLIRMNETQPAKLADTMFSLRNMGQRSQFRSNTVIKAYG